MYKIKICLSEDRANRKRETYKESRKYWHYRFKSIDHKIVSVAMKLAAIERLKLRREDIDIGKISDIEIKLDGFLSGVSFRCYSSHDDIRYDSCDDSLEWVKDHWRRY